MKTGYFYNLRQAEIKGAVSIALGNPRYVKVPYSVKLLAPTRSLLAAFRNEQIDEDEYTLRFNEQLSKLDAQDVMDKLNEMTGGDEPVLMCHCNRESFCHRHLVAEWFERELGVKMDEFASGEVERKNGRLV